MSIINYKYNLSIIRLFIQVIIALLLLIRVYIESSDMDISIHIYTNQLGPGFCMMLPWFTYTVFTGKY